MQDIICPRPQKALVLEVGRQKWKKKWGRAYYFASGPSSYYQQGRLEQWEKSQPQGLRAESCQT